ncbi:16S rRNA (cytosine(967)-C(5))-methyltransferase RsmB [Marinicella meishanensis]|uniref:16S rRNA (cytosine(967)-C(5))-methyltransferase RsmB n=1 Tax=Marinicella meishanensis TaxID=2873263 RepID=UPI001CBC61EC|nr:16S rRNA (cytosine(967)-C(5))-methyltransferase RsmB [Marinicella sp. NBU2979]
MNATAQPTRLLATQVLYQVVHKQQHLKAALQAGVPNTLPAADRAWIQNICYQTLRHHQNLEARWHKFVDKPVKDKWLSTLLTLSVGQKVQLQTPDHAVVNEAIKAAKKMRKAWAAGLLNKVLKLTLADTDFKPSTESAQLNHTAWWLDLLRKDWPDHWRQIVDANNQAPPLWVRSELDWSAQSGQPHPHLAQAWRLTDTGTPIHEALQAGTLSVQDAAAQYAAHLLAPEGHDRVLDACAAPGGKSAHLQQLAPGIELDILEQDPDRLALVKDNFRRLKLKANRMILGDATQPKEWFQGTKYDKILLDVPCSASGVVRRHPDIKLLRQPEHLKPLTQLQQEILRQMAPLLQVGGTLLYATCSVFRSENERAIKKFLQHNPSFSPLPMAIEGAVDCAFGQQILTGSEHMDGFYYCLLRRTA